MAQLPHLVVARLEQQAGEAGFQSANMRSVQMMLKRLFARLPLSGRCAVSIERRRGVTELMCAFERDRDADEAARVVGAASTAPYAGWQTQRNFVLDGLKQDELVKIAGEAQTRRRPRAWPA